MKRLIIAVCLLGSLPCLAGEFSSHVTVANDYIWRGRSLTADVAGTGAATGVPVVQGTIQYDHESGFGANIFASNIFIGYEFIPMIYYNYKMNDFTFQVEAQEYFFPKYTKGNTVEYGVSVMWKGVTALAQYNPEYLGSETPCWYYNVGYAYDLNPKLIGIAAIGYSKFGDATDEAKVGASNYADYKVGVQYHKDEYITEMAFVTANRETISAAGRTKPYEDKYLISLTKNF